MKNNDKKKKIPFKYKMLSIVIFVLGIFLISLGILINIKSNPKKVMRESLYNLYTTICNNINYKQEIINFNNNFMVDSSFKIESTYNKDDEYINYFFNALNNTNNDFTYAQDLSNKKLYLNIDSKKNNNNFIFEKILINNATEYIKTDNNTKQYINRGTSNYFEIYNNDYSYNDNFNYLVLFFTNSFINNIEDKDFIKEQAKTMIGSEEKKLNKISVYINNDKLIKILNRVHIDISNDERVKSLVASIDNEYKDKEISMETNLLRKESSLELIIYIDSFYKTKKYELVYQNGIKETRISYTPLDNYSLITLMDGKSIEKIYKITGNNDKYDIEILNAKNQNIGSMTIENSKDRFNILSNSETDDNKIILNVDRILSKMTSNSYDSSLEIHYSNTNKITKRKEVTIDIKGYTKVSKNVIINENIDNNIIYDTLSKEEKEYIDNYNIKLLSKIHKMEDVDE